MVSSTSPHGKYSVFLMVVLSLNDSGRHLLEPSTTGSASEKMGYSSHEEPLFSPSVITKLEQAHTRNPKPPPAWWPSLKWVAPYICFHSRDISTFHHPKPQLKLEECGGINSVGLGSQHLASPSYKRITLVFHTLVADNFLPTQGGRKSC